MQLKSIQTEADYDFVLREIEHLWGLQEGTPEGDRLDALTSLAEAYESAQFPMDLNSS